MLARYCYIDMDGFFASAEQHFRPELRGRPVGVHAGVPCQRHGVLISVSRQAKAAGIKSGMRSRDAVARCRPFLPIAQRPVEYIRLHHALVACVEQVAPVHEVHSVDEVSLVLSRSDEPAVFMDQLREAVGSSFSPALTFAAGVASSVWLAKVAAECGKGPSGERGGAVDWTRPDILPGALFELDLEDLPQIGPRKGARLRRYGVETVRDYYAAPLFRIRDAYGSVDGERIWLAMHGHDVRWKRREVPASLSHGRVLDPASRADSEPIARWLALCGWLRARRLGLRPRVVLLEARSGDHVYVVRSSVAHPGGEVETLRATSAAWCAVIDRCSPERIAVTLSGLDPDPSPQMPLFECPASRDRPLEVAVADLRTRYGIRAIQRGRTGDPTGPYTGLKVAFDRVPSLDEVDLFVGPRTSASCSPARSGFDFARR